MTIGFKRTNSGIVLNEPSVAIGVHRVFGIQIRNGFFGFHFRDLKSERKMKEEIVQELHRRQAEAAAEERNPWDGAMGVAGAKGAAN